MHQTVGVTFSENDVESTASGLCRWLLMPVSVKTELEATATSCAVVVDVQGVEVGMAARGTVDLAYHRSSTTDR